MQVHSREAGSRNSRGSRGDEDAKSDRYMRSSLYYAPLGDAAGPKLECDKHEPKANQRTPKTISGAAEGKCELWKWLQYAERFAARCISTVELESCASAGSAIVTTSANAPRARRHKMIANAFLISVRCIDYGDWIQKNKVFGERGPYVERLKLSDRSGGM
jgi:hypothetical protein